MRHKNLKLFRFFTIFACKNRNKMDFITDILQYNYLSNALMACVLSGITCGIIGTYIVARRMVFLCGGITHASFGGLGIAFYFGANPILGATVFAILSALGIEWSNSRSKIRPDLAIGMVWGIGMAIGAFFIALRPGYTSDDMANFLFGNKLVYEQQHPYYSATSREAIVKRIMEYAGEEYTFEKFKANDVNTLGPVPMALTRSSAEVNYTPTQCITSLRLWARNQS